MGSPPNTAAAADAITPQSETANNHTLARSASIVSVATMTSRILGLLREQVLLIGFGSATLDVFYVAFRIPNLLRDLFAEGAMSASFVPTFTRVLKEDGRTAAWELGNLVISGLLVVTGIIAVAGMIFAAPLTRFIAENYASTPGKLELTTQLTQIMFPFLMLVAVAVAGMGMLNALRWFFIPALAPAMFNIVTIISVIVVIPLARQFNFNPLVGLAVGTLAGGAAQTLLQWPALRREGFRFRFRLAPRDPRLREVLTLMVPGTLGLAAVQINQLINVWLATGQVAGAVTWLQTAFRLIYLPIGLFGVSIATASLPTIARHAAEEDEAGIRSAVSQGLRLMLMLNVPATLGLVTLAGPIADLIYNYGSKVHEADVHGMAVAVMCYSPGLVGYSVVKILSPTFYSLRDSRTPVLVSLLSIAINITLNLTLVQVLGFGGLALGTGLAALVNAVTLFVLLRNRLHGIDGRRIATAFAKILVASLVMAAVAWSIEHWLAIAWPGRHLIQRAVRVGLAVGGGVGTLVLTAKLLRLQELDTALGSLLRRVRR